MKKIWIDIDNSPHVPFFSPISSMLAMRGYELILTARNAYQVKELLNVYQVPARLIGRHYGKQKFLKMAGCFYRMLQLAPLIIKKRPDVAVSHGSRSMLFLSKLLHIPLITIFDYEYGQTVPFIKPDLVITPEIVTQVPFYQTRVLKYKGIKEDVYVPFFKPNSDLKAELGLEESIIVTLRPPATEAHYHNSDSEILFDEVVEFLAEKQDIQMVVLPRNTRQAETIQSRWARLYAKRKLVIPPPLDGLSMLWNSDLVISGGGTMNREAAALGVPVYSIFRGKAGAVDLYLEREGKLTFIKERNDIRSKIELKKRHEKPFVRSSNAVLEQIVSFIILFTERPQDISQRDATTVQFEQRPSFKFIH